MFGPWQMAAWAAEFVLETSGAVLAYRRKLNILFLLLAWRALADIITSFMHGRTYGYTMWGGRAVQYAILYALALQIAAKMVAEYRAIWRHVYMTVALVASIATWEFVTTRQWGLKDIHTKAAQLEYFHTEAVCSLLLLAVVLIGWVGKKKRLEEPWKLISFGLVVSSAGNAVCAIAASLNAHALKIYPIPAILALLVWNLSVLPRKRIKMLIEPPLPLAALEQIAAIQRDMERLTGAYLPPPPSEKPGDRTATALEAMRQNQERKPVESVGLSAEDAAFLKEMRIQA